MKLKYLSNASLTALLGLIKSKFATKTELAEKQNTLTFDSTPTAGSTNPVTSGGVKSALDNKLSLTGGTLTGNLNAPSFQTGESDSNFFQCKKFRGEGDANTYYHAIDFGYASHDQVDFYEYGGIWNFWKNTASTKGGTLVGSIQPNGWNGNVVGNVTGNLTGLASKATADSNGNNIINTYATKTSLDNYLTTSNASSTYLTKAESGEFVTQAGLREIISPTYPVTKFTMKSDFQPRRIGVITIQGSNGSPPRPAPDLHFKLKITWLDTTFSVNDETLVANISSDGQIYRLSSFSESISASDEESPLGLYLVPGSVGEFNVVAIPMAPITFLSSQFQTYDLQSGCTVSFEFDRALPIVAAPGEQYMAEFKQHLSSIAEIQMYFPDYLYANDKYAQKTELVKTEYAFDITD